MPDTDTRQAALAQPDLVNGNSRAGAADQQVASAAFNPFAGVAAQVQPLPATAPQPTPDWSLPLIAMVLGLACIAAMLRRLLD
jgi:hypothetical protein